MTPKRLSAKFFLNPARIPDVDTLIPVFHEWIASNALDEMLIDVADYSHVHEGPALMLVALEADYVFDFADGRPGLRYIRKRNLPAALNEALALVIGQAARAAALLEDATSATFNASTVEIDFLDKLRFDPSQADFSQLEETLGNIGRTIIAEDVEVVRTPTDHRRPLKLHMKTRASVTSAEIAKQYVQSSLIEGEALV